MGDLFVSASANMTWVRADYLYVTQSCNRVRLPYKYNKETSQLLDYDWLGFRTLSHLRKINLNPQMLVEDFKICRFQWPCTKKIF